MPDHETLLAAVRASVLAAGRRPIRLHQFLKVSGFRKCDIFKYYPVWNDVMRAAGFDFQPYNTRIEERRLLADWAAVVRKLRRTPTVREYAIHGKYSSATFENHFDRWNHVPDAFRAFAGRRRKWKPVVRLLPASPGIVSRSESEPDPGVATPSRTRPGIAPQSGTKPDARPITPKNNPNKARRRFPRRRRSTAAPRLRGRPASGPPLSLPGMRNAPVNELGVICLFALLAPQLGFEIEALQAAFPDCEARRKIAPDKWQSIRIEFEHQSRDFHEHGHDPSGCDVIVCWTHNWSDCPKNLEVIALSEEIKQLAAAS